MQLDVRVMIEEHGHLGGCSDSDKVIAPAMKRRTTACNLHLQSTS